MIPGIVASGKSSPWTPLDSTTSITNGASYLTITGSVVRFLNSFTSSPIIYESRDNGASWTPFSPGFPNGCDGYAFDANYVVAAGSSGLRIRRRVNDAASAFQVVTPDPLTLGLGTGIVYNGTYFATTTVGNGVAAQAWSSTSGGSSTWVQRTVTTPAPNSTVFVYIRYLVGTIVAIGQLGSGESITYYAMYSADGVSWAGSGLPSFSTRPSVGSTGTELVFSVPQNTTSAYTHVPGSNTYIPATLGVPAVDIKPYNGRLYGVTYDRRGMVYGDSLETLQVLEGTLPGNRGISSFDFNVTTGEIWATSSSNVSGGVIWKRPIPT